MTYNYYQGVIKTKLNKILFAMIGVLFALSYAILIFGNANAAHNGAIVSTEVGVCEETAISATIDDPDGSHIVGNMFLVVSANGGTQYENIPTNGSSVDIVIGPFAEDTTVSWNVFGGGERSYDQPLWDGFGEPDFGSDIDDYADEQGGFSWVLDGPDEPNPFVNWNEVEVQGCSPEVKNECKAGGWEAFGFKNQGQCVRFVNTGKDSR